MFTKKPVTRVLVYLSGLCILALGLTLSTKADLGLSKNIVDITCVTLTCILSMTVAHRILGVGIGTLIAMIGIGRVIAFVNKLFGEKLALLLSDTQL